LLVAACTGRILKTAYRTPANFIDSAAFRDPIRPVPAAARLTTARIWVPETGY
jgi:hypothetical protein